MTVFDYMIVEAFTGVERDLAKKLIINLKDLKDIIPICNCVVSRKAFLTVYNLFPKIETIPESDKKEFWEWARTNFPGKSKAELIENCKIVYTAGELLNEKK